MKKSMILACGAALMLAAASCSNNQKTETATSADAAQAPAPASAAVANAKAGAKYLHDLKAKDSTVVITESGLGYRVIKEGNGPKPTANDVALVNYKGTHLDGTVFDANDGIEFPLGGVIEGFREGLMLMPEGSVYELYIPGNLGYGENGTPDGSIGPNEMLVFELELVDIK